MENQMFTGIGCFAKPDRLGRIFSKLVQNYTLGPFKENQLFDGPISKESEGADLLQALMAGLTTGSIAGAYESPNFSGPKKITGFFLSLKDQKLNLSIFARGNSSKREVYTTSLAELTKIRKKRLN
jgi:hypothetical protein